MIWLWRMGCDCLSSLDSGGGGVSAGVLAAAAAAAVGVVQPDSRVNTAGDDDQGEKKLPSVAFLNLLPLPLRINGGVKSPDALAAAFTFFAPSPWGVLTDHGHVGSTLSVRPLVIWRRSRTRMVDGRYSTGSIRT